MSEIEEAKDLLVQVLLQTQETHTPEMESVIKKIREFLEKGRANERGLAEAEAKASSGETKT